jgi:hypothetical protein
LFGAAIDKIADKYCFSGVVLKYAPRFGIPKRDEQTAKGICVAVHVTNYVIVLAQTFFLRFLFGRAIILTPFASERTSFIW